MLRNILNITVNTYFTQLEYIFEFAPSVSFYSIMYLKS